MYQIGDIIKKSRESQGITQERLSEGICSVSTLSRLENNERMPSRTVFNKLMQKLGRNSDIYDSYVDESEFKFFLKKRELQQKLLWGEKTEVGKLLYDLKMLLDNIDELNLQFYEFINVFHNEKKYSNEELFKKYYEILELTIPNFNEERITCYLLGIDEQLIINAIACKYSNMGEYQKAIKIVTQLINNLEEKYVSIEDRERIYSMLLYNLSKWQGIEEQYELAIATCDKGIQFCNSVKSMVNYGELLYNKGFNYIKLDKIIEGAESMKMAYYIFLVQNNLAYAEHTKETLLKLTNIEIM